MIESEIKFITRTDGEIQRLQLVKLPDWDWLEFFRPRPAEDPLPGLSRIYRQFLVPACPWIFGQMALLRVPAGIGIPESDPAPGDSEDRLFRAAELLREGMRLVRGRPLFRTEEARSLWEKLESAGALAIVCGKLPITKVIPVSKQLGFLSESGPQARLRVNASFFIMDPFDCASPYDSVGTPFGLCVKDGEILSPPMYEREALLVEKSGRVYVGRPSVRELAIKVGGRLFRAGENAEVFTRPACRQTAPDGVPEAVIIGRKVVAAGPAGGLEVPASGFVLRSPQLGGIEAGETVLYHGLEDIAFGIQVGSSLLKDGVRSGRFLSPYYNIRSIKRTAYPPSLYPLNYKKDRAARIALGADQAGRPMLLWAEGAPKIGYRKGINSCGASLSEMEEYCEAAGMVNAVNLDGGGSAQILLEGKRQLELSDRNENGSGQERPVPLGLIVY